MEIKRLLVINVPIKNCNLKCEYCYISALKENEKGAAKFLYTPEHVGKCLSKERLGGTCIDKSNGRRRNSYSERNAAIYLPIVITRAFFRGCNKWNINKSI